MNATRFLAAERRTWESHGIGSPREHRVHLERNNVTVRIQEVGEGPPVLFVHGALVNGTSWASLVARVRGFRCFLLDRPGCGLSDPLVPPPSIETLPRFADTLVIDVLDALEIESAHLVSASFGGYFALRGAASHPDRFGRLLQFSFPIGAPAARLPISMRIMGWPLLWRLLLLPASETSVRMMFRQIGQGPALKAGRIKQEDIEGWLALLRFTDTRRNEMAMGRAFFTQRGIRQLTLTDDLLASIQAPVYLYWGEEEPAGGPDTARLLVDRIPHAETELIPGAGHAPWLDDLDQAAETIGRFFGR